MTERSIFVNVVDGIVVDDGLLTWIRRAVTRALDTGKLDAEEPESTELSVTILDARAMRELNARFHGVDAPTDVLAFGMAPAGSEDGALVGDVYVCRDVAAEFSEEHDEPLEDELVRLAIHGTLHLLGHDHPEGEDRYGSAMYVLQEELLEASR